MLNVNRILIFLTITIFSSSLYAFDVSKFDIKGIKLGMSKSEVLKRMPCSNPIHEYGYFKNIEIRCNSEVNPMWITFDMNNKVYAMGREIILKIEPNWDTIESKLLKHYGKTNKILRNNPSSHNTTVFSICYGQCTIPFGKSYKNKENKKSLTIWASSYKSLHFISFRLLDGKAEELTRQWYEKKEKQLKMKQKRKASNIDL